MSWMTACRDKASPQEMLSEYFKEIVCHNEYDHRVQINRWEQDVQVAFIGFKDAYLEKEIVLILEELNSLIESIEIQRVEKPEKANLIVFMGNWQEYTRTWAPQVQPLSPDTRGAFWVATNGKGLIQRGRIWIDGPALTRPSSKKHILREELTQALGFFNDSDLYPDSIFYQGWTLTQSYSDLDRALIRMLYQKDLPKICGKG